MPYAEKTLFDYKTKVLEGEIDMSLSEDPEKKRPGRKKRFERNQTERIRLTDRDREIIGLVYRHRFINSEQIIALIEGSHKGLLRRLSLLYHAGYLDRPKAQLTKLGFQPIVYALGNKGAELIADAYGHPLAAVDWTSKNREAKDSFLEHTLMVSQFLTVMRLACRDRDDLEFIEPETIALNRPVEPSGSNKPLAWQIPLSRDYPGFTRGYRLILVPDSAFGIRRQGKNGQTNTSYFFLEADRSTMPVRRSNLQRSSYYKKLVGYWDSWQHRDGQGQGGAAFKENFGFSRVRILTLTMSEARIQTMLNANQEIDQRGKGSRMFLFAPAKIFTLEKPELVFHSGAWLDGRSESTGLLVD